MTVLLRPQARPRTKTSDRLRAEGTVVQFEGVRALDQVDLTLQQGEIVGLIGPNGAGKTTLVNVLSGFQRPAAGRVFLDESDVTRDAAHRRARRGISRTFQGVRLFGNLTVEENVRVALTRDRSRSAGATVDRLLDLMRLSDRRESIASSLPYGDERRLGIARALASSPSFLLLDEPAAGMDETETAELREAIVQIRDDFGCGLLVIEHDMPLIMRLCERVQVLDYGKTISLGTPDQVQSDPAVMEAYLGSGRAEPS